MNTRLNNALQKGVAGAALIALLGAGCGKKESLEPVRERQKTDVVARVGSAETGQQQRETSLEGPLILEDRLAFQVRAQEPEIYQQHALTTSYEIVREGKQLYAFCRKNGETFFKRPVSALQALTIRRLYEPSKFFGKETLEPAYTFNSKIQATDYQILHEANDALPVPMRVSAATLDAAHKTLRDAGQNARSILQALDLLSKEKNTEEVHYALRTIPYLLQLGYANGTAIIKDSAMMDARTFYEVVKTPSIISRVPWRKDLTDDDMMHIIAWRSTQEPLQRTRRHLALALEELMQRPVNVKTQEDAFRELNTLGHAIVGFQMRGPVDQSIYGQLMSNSGRCEDQVNFVQELGRAAVLPIKAIHVPAWPKANGNHVFLGLPKKDTSGKTVGYHTLNACDNMKSDTLDAFQDCVAAKLYAFSPYEPFTAAEDVTRFLTRTKALSITQREFIRQPSRPSARLLVYNGGSLANVAEAPITPQGIYFNDVGCKSDLLYVIGEKVNGNSRIQTLTHPFIFREDGSKRYLAAMPHVVGGTKNFIHATLGEKEVGERLEAKEYTIAAWIPENGGQFFPMGTSRTEQQADGTYQFINQHVSSDGVLYHVFERISNNQARPIGRPFTVENSEVKRY